MYFDLSLGNWYLVYVLLLRVVTWLPEADLPCLFRSDKK